MSVRDEVLEALARNLWVQAYASFADDTDDDGNLNEQFMADHDLSRPGAGGDWDDHAPPTPDAFTARASEALLHTEMQTRKTIDELVGQDDPEEWGRDYGFHATGSGGASGYTSTDKLRRSEVFNCEHDHLYVGDDGNVYMHPDVLVLDFSGSGTSPPPSGMKRFHWNPYYVRIPRDEREYGPYSSGYSAKSFARIGSQYGSPREVYYSPTKDGKKKRIRRYEGGERTWARGNPPTSVVAELDHIANSIGDPNLIGSLRRVPTSAYYRPPPRGSPADVPDDMTLRAWLAQARHVARVLRSRSNPRITGTPDWELPSLVEQQEHFRGAAQCDRCGRWIEVRAPVNRPFSCCLACMEDRGHDGTCGGREPPRRFR